MRCSTGCPTAVTVVRWAGAAFLAATACSPPGARCARPALCAPRRPQRTPLRRAADRVALTWLNPHVYLDTVVLLGSVAAAQGELRWRFGAGAAVGERRCGSPRSAPAPGCCARCSPGPAAWRVLDALIAVVMGVLAVGLACAADRRHRSSAARRRSRCRRSASLPTRRSAPAYATSAAPRSTRRASSSARAAGR